MDDSQNPLNVDVWLRGTDFAKTQIIEGVERNPSAWTDNDVSKLLKAMLLAIHRAKNPESTNIGQATILNEAGKRVYAGNAAGNAAQP